MEDIESLVNDCLGNDAEGRKLVPRSYRPRFYCGVCKPRDYEKDACPFLDEVKVIDVGAASPKLARVYTCKYEVEK